DIQNELKLNKVNVYSADYGSLPDLSRANFDNDVVFTWNGTTSGVKVPDGDWIASERKGLTFCDATSAVFAMDLPWDKLDITTYSWQKVLGGEAAHGMLILSPRAAARLTSYKPDRPLPKIFRMLKKGELNEGIFKGSTINTPSMLCNEDYLSGLNWVESIGGLKTMIERSENNLKIITDFVQQHDWISFLAKKPETRSCTSVCLCLDLNKDQVSEMVKLLADEKAAYDCKSYRDAPTGLRLWCGGTIESQDLHALMPWLQWAYEQVR
ncbi:MAG TPA: phosphoserine transaminase, partial [Spirochaetota bacterium]|nr:phosphoserine transaminase [Spirochaetota bacterium]